MLVADGAAMLVFQFTDRFNILHVGAIVNLLCIVLAIVPVLRTPRPSNWKNQHYYWMSWSYVGLLAAAATELVVRTSHLATRGTGLDGNRCGFIVSDRDRLCHHQPISAGFGIATGFGRRNDAA
jgi:hypothetical protein